MLRPVWLIAPISLSLLILACDGRPGSQVRDVEVSVVVRSGVPEASVSPLLTGTGVLHIKGTQALLTQQGEEVQRLHLEFWFDRANGDARFEARDLSGTDRQILLREGQTYSVYFPDRDYVNSHIETPENGPAAMPKPVREMFSEKMALDGFKTAQYPGTKLVVVGEETSDGKTALVVAPKVAANPVKNPAQPKFRVYIDKATGLTLKVVGVGYTIQDRAGVNGTRLFQYDVIERIDRAELPEDWFSIRALTTVPKLAPEPSRTYNTEPVRPKKP